MSEKQLELPAITEMRKADALESIAKSLEYLVAVIKKQETENAKNK